MSDLLIRGIPHNIRNQIQHYADSQNLSVNQFVLQVLKGTMEGMEKDGEKEKRQREAFRRIKEIRERLHRKYGKMDDSTKLIREDRDSR